MPELVFRFDDGSEELFALLEDRIGVGREPDNRIVIDNDFISGHHARFIRDAGGGYRLIDLGSQNGTFINGAAIGEALVRHGDRIRFGVYEVGYLDPAAAGELPTEQEEVRLDGQIQAKRAELDSLAFRVAQLEDIARSLEGRLAPLVNPVLGTTITQAGGDGAAAGAGERDGHGASLIDEVERLEARYQEAGRLLEERRGQLRDVTKVQLPEAEARLAEARQRKDEADAEWGRLRRQIEEAEVRKREFDALEQGYGALQAAVEAIEKEHLAKKELLELTARDLAEADAKLRETRRSEEDARRATEQVLRRREIAEEECRDFAGKLQEQTRELQAGKERLAAVRAELAAEQDRLSQALREREDAARALRHAQERVRLSEDRVKGVIASWDECEKTTLDEIARRKAELDEQYASSEARLRKTREELDAARAQMAAEKREAEQRIEELRTQHYEPARQLHEELLLRSQSLAAELAAQERRLDLVRRTIRDGEETEKLVAHSLERRGRALESLEERIGEEVAQIRAEFVSLQRPLTWEGPAPVPDFGPIFRTREASATPVGRRSAPSISTKVSLAVYLPDQGKRTWDFRHRSELKVDEEPLPVGFAGLAAATRGAVFTSLAMTVESGLPVLFPPAGGLAATVAALKKLRSAMPQRIILGGWTREAFEGMTEELHAGTNFQDLLGVLTLLSGSITTDPYMNTFFESMNHGQRFLYLAPVLPWNARAQPSFEGRKGLVVDLRGFDPASAPQEQLLRELREWVEETREVITVNEPSRGVTRRFREQLGLGPDWVRVRNPDGYADWLELLRGQWAVLSLDPLHFGSELLRDALLSHTPALGPQSEAMTVFYPELAEYEGGRQMPVAPALRRLGEREVHERVARAADKRLLAEHSYQAAAKKLDEFLGSISR